MCEMLAILAERGLRYGDDVPDLEDVRYYVWIVPSTVSLCRRCGSEPIGSLPAQRSSAISPPLAARSVRGDSANDRPLSCRTRTERLELEVVAVPDHARSSSNSDAAFHLQECGRRSSELAPRRAAARARSVSREQRGVGD